MPRDAGVQVTGEDRVCPPGFPTSVASTILQASRHESVQHLTASLKSQMARFQYGTILTHRPGNHSLAEHQAIAAMPSARCASTWATSSGR